jgi:transposase, IS30 family
MSKYKQLTQHQRYQMEVLIKKRISKSEIARTLQVDRSTIFRELKRNKGKGKYRAGLAHQRAEERKERFAKDRRLTSSVEQTIRKYLNEEWSPEQIHGYCKKNKIEMVSHETIYQFIYRDKQLGGELYKKLRIALKPYRKRYGKHDRRGKIPDRVGIDQRPEDVATKKRYGDWEADTIIGNNYQGAVLTLVERKSYFTKLAKLDTTQAAITKKQMINSLAPYKENVLTITSDNGHEFYEHKTITKKLQADYYFTHPYSAWEKGINENTNGLIRQYLPKKINLKMVSEAQLMEIENKLNNRPRKSLN